jgi:hypothetical protein
MATDALAPVAPRTQLRRRQRIGDLLRDAEGRPLTDKPTFFTPKGWALLNFELPDTLKPNDRQAVLSFAASEIGRHRAPPVRPVEPDMQAVVREHFRTRAGPLERGAVQFGAAAARMLPSPGRTPLTGDVSAIPPPEGVAEHVGAFAGSVATFAGEMALLSKLPFLRPVAGARPAAAAARAGAAGAIVGGAAPAEDATVRGISGGVTGLAVGLAQYVPLKVFQAALDRSAKKLAPQAAKAMSAQQIAEMAKNLPLAGLSEADRALAARLTAAAGGRAAAGARGLAAAEAGAVTGAQRAAAAVGAVTAPIAFGPFTAYTEYAAMKLTGHDVELPTAADVVTNMGMIAAASLLHLPSQMRGVRPTPERVEPLGEGPRPPGQLPPGPAGAPSAAEPMWPVTGPGKPAVLAIQKNLVERLGTEPNPFAGGATPQQAFTRSFNRAVGNVARERNTTPEALTPDDFRHAAARAASEVAGLESIRRVMTLPPVSPTDPDASRKMNTRVAATARANELMAGKTVTISLPVATKAGKPVPVETQATIVRVEMAPYLQQDAIRVLVEELRTGKLVPLSFDSVEHLASAMRFPAPAPAGAEPAGLLRARGLPAVVPPGPSPVGTELAAAATSGLESPAKPGELPAATETLRSTGNVWSGGRMAAGEIAQPENARALHHYLRSGGKGEVPRRAFELLRELKVLGVKVSRRQLEVMARKNADHEAFAKTLHDKLMARVQGRVREMGREAPEERPVGTAQPPTPPTPPEEPPAAGPPAVTPPKPPAPTPPAAKPAAPAGPKVGERVEVGEHRGIVIDQGEGRQTVLLDTGRTVSAAEAAVRAEKPREITHYPSKSRGEDVRITSMAGPHLVNAEAKQPAGPLKEAMRAEMGRRGFTPKEAERAQPEPAAPAAAPARPVEPRAGAVRPVERGAGGERAPRARVPVQGEGGERISVARAEFTTEVDESGVPADLRGFLTHFQRQGAAKALIAMRDPARAAFLLADGTGVGKTRQILAVAETYRREGHLVVILTPNEVLGKPWEAKTLKANAGKPTVTGSYAQDSAAMGVSYSLWRPKDGPMPSSGIVLTTYTYLTDAEFTENRRAVYVFDESHALKNAATGTRLAVKGRTLANAAHATLFSSATPADKPTHIEYLARIGILEGKSLREAVYGLGFRLAEKGGRTFWVPQRGIRTEEILKRMSALFDRMTQKGSMVKREIGLDGVDIHFRRLALPKETHATLRRIGAHFDESNPRQRAIMLMHQRRQQEPVKAEVALEIAKRELAAGRRVILFVSRVNWSEVQVAVGRLPGGEVEKETIAESEGTAKLLRAMLKKAGIPFSELHGDADVHAGEAMAAFQTGSAKVLVATVESGGTGINLDDTVGDAPRTLIMVTAPFNGVTNVQAAGRVWRMTTKSLPRIIYLFGDTPVDDWNAAIIAKKMETLGASVSGQVKRLLIDPDLLNETEPEDIGSLMSGEIGGEMKEPAPLSPSEPAKPAQLAPSEAPAVGTVTAKVKRDLGMTSPGECFRAARRWATNNDNPGTEVVHGKLTIEGTRFDHAWVELTQDREVVDPAVGKVFDQAEFYDKMKPEVDARYTPIQAETLAARTGHNGPWNQYEVAGYDLKGKRRYISHNAAPPALAPGSLAPPEGELPPLAGAQEEEADAAAGLRSMSDAKLDLSIESAQEHVRLREKAGDKKGAAEWQESLGRLVVESQRRKEAGIQEQEPPPSEPAQVQPLVKPPPSAKALDKAVRAAMRGAKTYGEAQAKLVAAGYEVRHRNEKYAETKLVPGHHVMLVNDITPEAAPTPDELESQREFEAELAAKLPAAQIDALQSILDQANNGPGDAQLLPFGTGDAFERLLEADGWTRQQKGKAVDWVKGDRSLFLRSQGPESSIIVQWRGEEPPPPSPEPAEPLVKPSAGGEVVQRGKAGLEAARNRIPTGSQVKFAEGEGKVTDIWNDEDGETQVNVAVPPHGYKQRFRPSELEPAKRARKPKEPSAAALNEAGPPLEQQALEGMPAPKIPGGTIPTEPARAESAVAGLAGEAKTFLQAFEELVRGGEGPAYASLEAARVSGQTEPDGFDAETAASRLRRQLLEEAGQGDLFGGSPILGAEGRIGVAGVPRGALEDIDSRPDIISSEGGKPGVWDQTVPVEEIGTHTDFQNRDTRARLGNKSGAVPVEELVNAANVKAMYEAEGGFKPDLVRANPPLLWKDTVGELGEAGRLWLLSGHHRLLMWKQNMPGEPLPAKVMGGSLEHAKHVAELSNRQGVGNTYSELARLAYTALQKGEESGRTAAQLKVSVSELERLVHFYHVDAGLRAVYFPPGAESALLETAFAAALGEQVRKAPDVFTKQVQDDFLRRALGAGELPALSVGQLRAAMADWKKKIADRLPPDRQKKLLEDGGGHISPSAWLAATERLTFDVQASVADAHGTMVGIVKQYGDLFPEGAVPKRLTQAAVAELLQEHKALLPGHVTAVLEDIARKLEELSAVEDEVSARSQKLLQKIMDAKPIEDDLSAIKRFIVEKLGTPIRTALNEAAKKSGPLGAGFGAIDPVVTWMLRRAAENTHRAAQAVIRRLGRKARTVQVRDQATGNTLARYELTIDPATDPASEMSLYRHGAVSGIVGSYVTMPPYMRGEMLRAQAARDYLPDYWEQRLYEVVGDDFIRDVQQYYPADAVAFDALENKDTPAARAMLAKHREAFAGVRRALNQMHDLAKQASIDAGLPPPGWLDNYAPHVFEGSFARGIDKLAEFFHDRQMDDVEKRELSKRFLDHREGDENYRRSFWLAVRTYARFVGNYVAKVRLLSHGKELLASEWSKGDPQRAAEVRSTIIRAVWPQDDAMGRFINDALRASFWSKVAGGVDQITTQQAALYLGRPREEVARETVGDAAVNRFAYAMRGVAPNFTQPAKWKKLGDTKHGAVYAGTDGHAFGPAHSELMPWIQKMFDLGLELKVRASDKVTPEDALAAMLRQRDRSTRLSRTPGNYAVSWLGRRISTALVGLSAATAFVNLTGLLTHVYTRYGALSMLRGGLRFGAGTAVSAVRSLAEYLEYHGLIDQRFSAAVKRSTPHMREQLLLSAGGLKQGFALSLEKMLEKIEAGQHDIDVRIAKLSLNWMMGAELFIRGWSVMAAADAAESRGHSWGDVQAWIRANSEDRNRAIMDLMGQLSDPKSVISYVAEGEYFTNFYYNQIGQNPGMNLPWFKTVFGIFSTFPWSSVVHKELRGLFGSGQVAGAAIRNALGPKLAEKLLPQKPMRGSAEGINYDVPRMAPREPYGGRARGDPFGPLGAFFAKGGMSYFQRQATAEFMRTLLVNGILATASSILGINALVAYAPFAFLLLLGILRLFFPDEEKLAETFKRAEGGMAFRARHGGLVAGAPLITAIEQTRAGGDWGEVLWNATLGKMGDIARMAFLGTLYRPVRGVLEQNPEIFDTDELRWLYDAFGLKSALYDLTMQQRALRTLGLLDESVVEEHRQPIRPRESAGPPRPPRSTMPAMAAP